MMSGGPGAFKQANEPMNQNLVENEILNLAGPESQQQERSGRLTAAGDAVIHGGSNGGNTIVTMQAVEQAQ